MRFKDFILQSVLPSFFAAVTCITFVMAVIGSIFEPDAQVGYFGLFWPLMYGLLAAVIQLVNYSRRELTARQALVRKVLHFILLESAIMGVLYWGGAFTSMAVTISLALSIMVVYAAVSALLWRNDKRTADRVNQALGALQQRHRIND